MRGTPDCCVDVPYPLYCDWKYLPTVCRVEYAMIGSHRLLILLPSAKISPSQIAGGVSISSFITGAFILFFRVGTTY